MVTEPEDLLHLLAYVHLNPVSAGLVEDPSDYPWSGHRSLIGLEDARITDVAEALSCFCEDRVKARALYLDRLRAVAEAKWFRLGVRDLPWWRTVDDDEETVNLESAPTDVKTFEGEDPPEASLRPTLESIAELCEFRLRLGSNELSGKGRRPYTSWCRCLFTTLTVGWMGFSRKDVAGFLDKSTARVSHWLREGYELDRKEAGFRWNLEKLKAGASTLPVEWSELKDVDERH
jgi:hypothetical protein